MASFVGRFVTSLLLEHRHSDMSDELIDEMASRVKAALQTLRGGGGAAAEAVAEGGGVARGRL
eukprot:COSAG04_NODE_42_length_32379_cov_41.656691_7_plen_63_part_00